MNKPAIEPAPLVVDYPTSDGRPVAETERHFRELSYLAHALRVFHRSRPDVYVGSNLLVNYDRNDPRRHLSPDMFVAFGVRPGERRSYRLWEEEVPSFVLEITSSSTRREGLAKRGRYAAWGVAEYFLYDPWEEYLDPPLQGFALGDGVYHPIALEEMLHGAPWHGRSRLRSRTLGIDFSLRRGEFRLWDARTGEALPRPDEEAATRRAAEHRAARETAARLAAEDRLAQETAARQRETATREKAEAELAALRALPRRSRDS